MLHCCIWHVTKQLKAPGWERWVMDTNSQATEQPQFLPFWPQWVWRCLYTGSHSWILDRSSSGPSMGSCIVPPNHVTVSSWKESLLLYNVQNRWGGSSCNIVFGEWPFQSETMGDPYLLHVGYMNGDMGLTRPDTFYILICRPQWSIFLLFILRTAGQGEWRNFR